MTDGFRESTESWADLLRDCRRGGMTAPVLAVGDGALGFWKAVREVFPDTREQRCWWHKQASVLAALPKSVHPGAVAAMKEICNAEDIDKAQLAIKAFQVDYGAKYQKAVAKIVDDADVLLEFYRYPAEHWIHLRTPNPIECTFDTVRLRTKVTVNTAGNRKTIRSHAHGNPVVPSPWQATETHLLDRTIRFPACRASYVVTATLVLSDKWRMITLRQRIFVEELGVQLGLREPITASGAVIKMPARRHR